MATITRAQAIKLIEDFYKEVQESGTDDLEDIDPETQSDPRKMSDDELAEFIMANGLTDDDDVVVGSEIDEDEPTFGTRHDEEESA